jgi:segregation and condensation protein A
MNFSGPFDALLNEILHKDLPIWDIDLKPIVENFLIELEENKDELDVDTKTEFLTIASILIQLKIRKMIPNSSEVDIDEDLLKFENRDVLIAKLLECKTFKDVAEVFKENIASNAKKNYRFVGPASKFTNVKSDSLLNTKPEQLTKSLINLLYKSIDETVKLNHVSPITVTVRECVEKLWEKLENTQNFVSFRSLTEWCPTKVHTIASFLAILEMFKEGIVNIEQSIDLNAEKSNIGELQIQVEPMLQSQEYDSFFDNFSEEKKIVSV